MSAALTPAQRDPNWRKRPKFWTPERVFRLDELIRQGRSDVQIGKALGCTANAVNLARKRRHLPARRTVLLSARAVATQLGVSCAKSVVRWINAGWLRARPISQRCSPTPTGLPSAHNRRALIKSGRGTGPMKPRQPTDESARCQVRAGPPAR